MSGIIESGQLVTVTPFDADAVPEKGDVVLCVVKGREYLHLIKAVTSDRSRFQIGNNRGGINGWTGRNRIYGKVTQIEP